MPMLLPLTCWLYSLFLSLKILFSYRTAFSASYCSTSVFLWNVSSYLLLFCVHVQENTSAFRIYREYPTENTVQLILCCTHNCRLQQKHAAGLAVKIAYTGVLDWILLKMNGVIVITITLVNTRELKSQFDDQISFCFHYFPLSRVQRALISASNGLATQEGVWFFLDK